MDDRVKRAGRWTRGAAGATVGLAVLVGISGVLAPTAGARGQVSSVEPYYAVVTSAEAELRSGEGTRYYAVAKLGAGQVLRVDGLGPEWARVVYPAGTPAYVPADSATPDSGAGTVTLTQAVSPRAASLRTGGPAGSWKPATPQALAVGTRLKLLAPEVVGEGAGRAYLVEAPSSARGFVPLGALGRATPEQISAHLATMPPDAAVPATTSEGAGEAARPPVVIEQKPAEPTEAERRAASIRQLEATFEAVRKQQTDDDEIRALIAEFERAIGELGDAPGAAGLRARMTQRIEILRLRLDLQARLREMTGAQQTLGADAAALAEKIAAFERSRRYDIVGRLTASTIYDGTRLPLMYRVQSVGPAPTRTLGYVKPPEGEDTLGLGNKIGQIVGIVGEVMVDPSLRLSIVTAVRVDPLEPTLG